MDETYYKELVNLSHHFYGRKCGLVQFSISDLATKLTNPYETPCIY